MQLPSFEDIYDLSTADLRKLQQQLQANPMEHQQLLETVTLQIQQRKALEYFSEICQAENPYAKKVAAFNQQFLKLAAQAIKKSHNERMQGIGQFEPSRIPSEQQLQAQYSSQKISKTNQQPHSISNASVSYPSSSHVEPRHDTDQTDSRSITSEQNIHSNSDAVSTTTATSIKKEQKQSRVSVEVKMNIGIKKGQKGKINQILARTLVEDDGIIRRNLHNSPQTGGNPYKKFHIPGQKHDQVEQKTKTKAKAQSTTQISQKSIKSTKEETKSHKSIQQNQKKQIKGSKQSQSHDNKSKKQNNVTHKEEGKKDTGVKLPKIGQYKDLVELVKQEQQKKKQKQAKSKTQQNKLPHIQNTIIEKNDEIVEQIENGHQECEQVDEDKCPKKQEEQTDDAQGASRPSTTMNTADIIQQQEMEQSLSPDKVAKELQRKNYSESQQQKIGINQNSGKVQHEQNKSSKALSKDHLIEQKHAGIWSHGDEHLGTKDKIQNHSPTDSKFQTQLCQSSNVTKDQKKQTVSIKQQPKNSQYHTPSLSTKITVLTNINNNDDGQQKKNEEQAVEETTQTKQAIDYTRKLLQQIDTTEQQFVKIKNYDSQLQQEDSNINSNSPSTQSNDKSSENQMKKCYSEQYWAHVKEEAELKIKRFKQQKEYEEKIKLEKANNNKTDSITEDPKENEQNYTSDDEIDGAHIQSAKEYKLALQKMKKEEEKFDKQLALKSEQLNKIKKEIMRKTNKKVAEAQPAPKPLFLRPKPDFDYLSVYPTFNHIFSVMYLKPQSQALSEIPNLLRDMKTLFTAHLEHFANRSNFKPAIFLPFDHNGTFQLTDPKQLIAHAQQTYIDLKVMIERVQMFNSNLHGEFSADNLADQRYYRVVKTKEEVYDIITTAFMRRKGWKELPHGCSLRTSWNLFWSWSKPDVDLSKILVWQKINHFPFNKNLSRKDLLYKNLDQFRKTFKVSMPFLPLTFNLPKQFSQLSARFHEEQMTNRDNNYWIMKPIGKSRGRGIKVVSSLSQLNYTDNIVVQKYIINPMLIDGYKFDMRIYVLVTSFHPLEAFVYKEGFARLSTEKYTLDAHSIKNTFVHLTNFAINKNNMGSNTNFAGGSKISLKTLKDKVTRMGYSFGNIWSQVHEIIVKSLLGCSVSVPSFPTAFELFGYDIMVDQDSNCHLIQINASPSLQRSYMIDEIVKQNLIDDIVDLVDPPQFDKKQLIEVFNQRINSITNKKKITADEDLIGLARILKYKPVRKVGERPNKMGLFQQIAPSQLSKDLEVLIKAKSGANNPMNID